MSTPREEAQSSEDRVLSHYDAYDERARLTKGAGLLEYARMQEIIERFLEPPPKVVFDVGGGPGRYSCWLAGIGHEVHLVDPVPKHIDQALQASASQPHHPLASATTGDARSLHHPDGSADILLMMGPLYHLIDRKDRLRALHEAHRVLKADGLLVATAVNRFALLIDGLVSGYIDDPHFVALVEGDLADGRHLPSAGSPEYFTTAFFHRPEELEAEVSEAGFRQRDFLSVQGPGEYTTDLNDRMSDPARREQLLDLIRQVEREKTLLGMASHFVVIAEK